MPGDPEQCRLNAPRYLKISEASKPRRLSADVGANLNPTKRSYVHFLNLSCTDLQCRRLRTSGQHSNGLSIERVLASAVART
jgi:hypothetical protein